MLPPEFANLGHGKTIRAIREIRGQFPSTTA